MIILTLRTDNPQAEIALYDGLTPLAERTWQAHRQLADTIHTQVESLLTDQAKIWQDINGVVVFRGPGSFTGLRIGMSVANALAMGLNVPVVSEISDSWREKGVERILAGENEKIALPYYGAEANITLPIK